MQSVAENTEMDMSNQEKASSEAAGAIYGNGGGGATSSNKYVTFEEESAIKKKTSSQDVSGAQERRTTRVSLDSLLHQVKGDHEKLTEKEQRLVKVLKDLDADHDGTVSLMEIAQLGSKLEQAEEEERKLKKIIAALCLVLVGALFAIFIMAYAAIETSKELRIARSGNAIAKKGSVVSIPASEKDTSGRRLSGLGSGKRNLGHEHQEETGLWGSGYGNSDSYGFGSGYGSGSGSGYGGYWNGYSGSDYTAGQLSQAASGIAGLAPSWSITTNTPSAYGTGSSSRYTNAPPYASASYFSPSARPSRSDKAQYGKSYDGTPASSTPAAAYQTAKTDYETHDCRAQVVPENPSYTCGTCYDHFTKETGCQTTVDSGAEDFLYNMLFPFCEACTPCIKETIKSAHPFELTDGCQEFQKKLLSPFLTEESSDERNVDSPDSAAAMMEKEKESTFDQCVKAKLNQQWDDPFVNPPACQKAGVCISADASAMVMTTASACDVGASPGSNSVNMQAIAENLGTSVDTPIDLSLDKIQQKANRLAALNEYQSWEAEDMVCQEIAETAIPVIAAGETRYIVANPCLPPAFFSDCHRATIVEHEAHERERRDLAFQTNTDFQKLPKLEFDVAVTTPVTMDAALCNRFELSVSSDASTQSTPGMASMQTEIAAAAEETDQQKAHDKKIVLTSGGKLIVGRDIMAHLKASGFMVSGSQSLLQPTGPNQATTIDRNVLRVIMHCNSHSVTPADICGNIKEVSQEDLDNSWTQQTLPGAEGEEEGRAKVKALPEVKETPQNVNPKASYVTTIRDMEECSHLPAGFGCVEEDMWSPHDLQIEREYDGGEALYRVTETQIYHLGEGNVEVRVTVPPPEIDQHNKGGQTPDCHALMFSRVRIRVLKKSPTGENDELISYTLKKYTSKSVQDYYHVMGGGPENDWDPYSGGTAASMQSHNPGSESICSCRQNQNLPNSLACKLACDPASSGDANPESTCQSISGMSCEAWCLNSTIEAGFISSVNDCLINNDHVDETDKHRWEEMTAYENRGSVYDAAANTMYDGITENQQTATAEDYAKRYGDAANTHGYNNGDNSPVFEVKHNVAAQEPKCSYTPMTFNYDDVETCGNGPCVFACTEQMKEFIPVEGTCEVPADAEHVSDHTMEAEATRRRALRSAYTKRELSGAKQQKSKIHRLTPLERALRVKVAGHDLSAGRRLVGEGTADCFLDHESTGDAFCEICSEEDNEFHIDMHRQHRRLNKLVPHRRRLGDQTENMKRQMDKMEAAKNAANEAARVCGANIRNRNEAVSAYQSKSGSKDLDDPDVISAANLMDWTDHEAKQACRYMDEMNAKSLAENHTYDVLREAHESYLQNRERLNRLDGELEELYSEARKLEEAHRQAEEKRARADQIGDYSAARVAQMHSTVLQREFGNVRMNMTHSLRARDSLAVATLVEGGKAMETHLYERKREMCSLQVYHKVEGTRGAMRKTTCHDDMHFLSEQELKAMVFKYIPVSKSPEFFHFRCEQPAPFSHEDFNNAMAVDVTGPGDHSGSDLYAAHHVGPPPSAQFLQFGHGKDLPPRAVSARKQYDRYNFENARNEAVYQYEKAVKQLNQHKNEIAEAEQRAQAVLDEFNDLGSAASQAEIDAKNKKREAEDALKEHLQTKLEADKIMFEKMERKMNETMTCQSVPPDCPMGYVLRMDRVLAASPTTHFPDELYCNRFECVEAKSSPCGDTAYDAAANMVVHNGITEVNDRVCTAGDDHMADDCTHSQVHSAFGGSLKFHTYQPAAHNMGRGDACETPDVLFRLCLDAEQFKNGQSTEFLIGGDNENDDARVDTHGGMKFTRPGSESQSDCLSIDRETFIVKGMHNFNLQVQGFAPRQFIAELHKMCFDQTQNPQCYDGFEGFKSLDDWIESSSESPTMPMPHEPMKMGVRLGSSHSHMATDSVTGALRDSSMDNPYVEFYVNQYIPSPISSGIGIQVEFSTVYDLRSGTLITNYPSFVPINDIPGASGTLDLFPEQENDYEDGFQSMDICEEDFYYNRAKQVMAANTGDVDADDARADESRHDDAALCPPPCIYSKYSDIEEPTCSSPAPPSGAEYHNEPPYVPAEMAIGAVCPFDGLYHESCNSCLPHVAIQKQALHLYSGESVCLIPSPETCRATEDRFYCEFTRQCVNHCDACPSSEKLWGDSMNAKCVRASPEACKEASEMPFYPLHYCSSDETCVPAWGCQNCFDSFEVNATDFHQRVPGQGIRYHECVEPSPESCKGIDSWGNRIFDYNQSYAGTHGQPKPQSFCPTQNKCVESCHACEGFEFKAGDYGQCSSLYDRAADCTSASSTSAFCAAQDTCVSSCGTCTDYSNGIQTSVKGPDNFCMVPSAACKARGLVYCEQGNKCSHNQCADCRDNAETQYYYEGNISYHNNNPLAKMFAVDEVNNKCVHASPATCQSWGQNKIFCPASDSCLDLVNDMFGYDTATERLSLCAENCMYTDFEGHARFSEFISTVSPSAGCMTKQEAVAFCDGQGKYYCERLDTCVDDCSDGLCSAGGRVWNRNGTGAFEAMCTMENGHTCNWDETYCEIDNKCHWGCYECASFDGTLKMTSTDVKGDRICVAPSDETCAAEGKVFCPATNDCTWGCDMCMTGGDEMYFSANTVAGANAFGSSNNAYKYELNTKNSSTNEIHGRTCGTYQDKINECSDIRSGGTYKWCEIEPGNGHCVESCNDCEFTISIEEDFGMPTHQTNPGSTSSNSYGDGFNAGFAAGRTGGMFTIKYNNDVNNLCKTNGNECRKLSHGTERFAYCEEKNQCVAECTECPGQNFKDKMFDTCWGNATSYGQY